MAQYHQGQEVEIIEVYASLTARKTEVLRKAKIVSANLEHGVNLSAVNIWSNSATVPAWSSIKAISGLFVREFFSRVNLRGGATAPLVPISRGATRLTRGAMWLSDGSRPIGERKFGASCLVRQKAGRAAVHCHRAINVDRCVHCQRGSGAWWKDPGRILTPSRRIESCLHRCHGGGSDGSSPAPALTRLPIFARRWDGLNHHRCAQK
jgi:hypothetical protein